MLMINIFSNFASLVQIAIIAIALIVFLYAALIVHEHFMTTTKTKINDCDIFEKAELLSVIAYHNKDAVLKEECRSRYAQFISFKPKCVSHRPRATREREPSRIPVKQIQRVFHKSRNVRKIIRKYIAKNVPMTSKIHCFVNKCKFCHEKLESCPKVCHWKIKWRAPDVSPRLMRKLWNRKRLNTRQKMYKITPSIKYNYCQSLLTNPRPPPYCFISCFIKVLITKSVIVSSPSVGMSKKILDPSVLLIPPKQFVHHILKVMFDCLD